MYENAIYKVLCVVRIINDKKFIKMRIKAEDKAIYLVRKFVIKHNMWSENEYTLSKTITELKKELFNTQWFAPKEMAIMCVDEIIQSLKRDSDFTTTYESSKKYWNEVRECIAGF